MPSEEEVVSVLLQENSARPVEPDVTAEAAGVAVEVVVVVVDDVVLVPSLMLPSLVFSVVLLVLLFRDSPTPSPTPKAMARARSPTVIQIQRLRRPMLGSACAPPGASSPASFSSCSPYVNEFE